MKKLPIFIIIILFLAACKKDATNTAYDTSLSKLQAFKKNATNGYTFTTFSSSVFGQSSVETKITVVNNTITARDYIAYFYTPGGGTDTPTKTVTAQWHEEGATLNTHGSLTAWYLTLDDVYAKAKNEWLNVDKKTNAIYFETKNSGLISSAGYTPNGCQDDCFFGINIKSITAL
jgi:hypothetical protein